jgi:diaminohydroxyphosphoribosylaminopyrimidine deaminase/5-amino-6-(5-phosphoribosylamino)uracil reductase
VFTTTGKVDPQRMLFRSASAVPTVIATTEAGAAAATAAGIQPPVELVVGADLAGMLGALRARGITSLLVEGGAAVAQALIAADLVDRIYWVRAPGSLGAGISAFGDFRPGEATGWQVTEARALGPDTLLVTDRRLCLPAS